MQVLNFLMALSPIIVVLVGILVFKQSAFETPGIKAMLGILESGLLREEFASLGGYDTSDMGRIMWMG